jgi:hypothetical protein
MENNLFRQVNIESYVGGVKKVVSTKANIETFCLYDFLFFFTNSNKRRIIKEGAFEYTWINYSYIIDKNPCLFLNNTKIKRHLEILKELELIKILNDNGNIYICLINAELSMISKEPVMNHNQAVMNHNQDPVMNHNQDPVMNHNHNNNNNINNNKNINNNNLDIENSLEKENFLKKEKNIKKEKKSISEQALELYQPNEYFTLDDWREWVEYKQARCKNLTLQTFKQNFNFLLSLGVNARASINQSINHNYQGLFEVKQNNANSQNQSYFKGLSAKEQFASVADNSYNPDDYDFSKLPIYS